MKRRAVILAVIFSLLRLPAGATTAGSPVLQPDRQRLAVILCPGSDQARLNGQTIRLSAAPYVIGSGTTLVPIRFVASVFGGTVAWDDDQQVLAYADEEVEMTLMIGSRFALVNDNVVLMTEAPELNPDHRAMVPIRFIAETLGANVHWDRETDRIVIDRR